MSASRKSSVKPPKVALYETLLASIPELKRQGAQNPYTAVNGNMFTLLHKSESLAIRLPADKREEFLKKYKTKLFTAYGAVMKEYVAVPEQLLKNTKELKTFLESSYAYAKSLKPKPSRKKS